MHDAGYAFLEILILVDNEQLASKYEIEFSLERKFVFLALA